jgi:hypothetical protein
MIAVADSDIDTTVPLGGPLSIIRAPYMGCAAHDAVWAIVGRRTARTVTSTVASKRPRKRRPK